MGNSGGKNNEEPNKEKERIAAVSSGIVAGYVSEYLENVFFNILNREENILKDNFEFSDYLVSIIQGWAGGLLEDKLGDFHALIVGTGLQYVLYAAIDEIRGKEVTYDFIFDFLTDVFIISLLTFGYRVLFPKNDNNGTFFAFEDFSLEILISLYYALKARIRNGNSQKKAKGL
ncbi:MAG: hypothetical protein WBK54_06920 [Bacilli bacterium]|jgi:hypothetical protein|nr:hypothetical protein [Acholeplasmataceae bacterium]